MRDPVQKLAEFMDEVSFLQTSVVSIHREAWVSSIETVKSGLQATLIIKCLGLDWMIGVTSLGCFRCFRNLGTV